MKQIMATAIMAAVVSSAHAGTIGTGTYRIHNHPDGSANPPAYGLRLDELYNTTGGHDIFTFDFNDPASFVTLRYNGSSIIIEGHAVGGRDIGGAYAAEATTGVYSFSFTYNIGVGMAPGDDDVMVIADLQNFGWISTPTGDLIDLVDKSDGNYSFRLGDEDNDAGHRGFAGISGWGWLNHGPAGSPHIAASDWIFTVGDLIPTPSTLAFIGMAGALVATRRR